MRSIDDPFPLKQVLVLVKFVRLLQKTLKHAIIWFYVKIPHNKVIMNLVAKWSIISVNECIKNPLPWDDGTTQQNHIIHNWLSKTFTRLCNWYFTNVTLCCRCFLGNFLKIVRGAFLWNGYIEILPYWRQEPQYLLECRVEFGMEVSEFKCNTVN